MSVIRVETMPGPVKAGSEKASGVEEMLERGDSGGVAVEDCDLTSTVNGVLSAVHNGKRLCMK